MKNHIKLVAVVIIIASFFASCSKEKFWTPTPPLPGLEKQMTVFNINPLKDTLLILESETMIFIPAGAMKSKDGKPIDGEYELHYREFHDGLDIFLAGITMDFNSMGEQRHFQTAGMFQIYAYQNGEELKLADDKSIDIRFGSKYPGDHYSFFIMDEESGEWRWVDLPETAINSEKVQARLELESKAPKLYMGDEYFVFSYYGFLDIFFNNDRDKIYNHSEDKNVRKKLEAYNVRMLDYKLAGDVRFQRAYYHPAELLWKDKDGKAFPGWLKDFYPDWSYNSKNRQYYITNLSFKYLENNEISITFTHSDKRSFTKVVEPVIPLKNLLKLSPEKWKEDYDKAMEELIAEQAKVDAMAETYRAFSLNQLGTFNFDALLRMDNWFRVIPKIIVDNTIKNTNDVVLIFGDNSGYMKFTPEELKDLRINPESGHRILLMLSDNEIGFFPADKFKELDIDELRNTNDPEIDFTFEKYKVTDAVSLREFLGF